MFPKFYMFLGTVVLAWFAGSAWLGWESRSPVRPLPTPGQLVVSSGWWRSGSSGYRGSSSSSTTRSGGGSFGGK